jgi:hypothetical protein
MSRYYLPRHGNDMWQDSSDGGGHGQSRAGTGDIISAEDIGTPQRLPIGEADQIFCVCPRGLTVHWPLREAGWLSITIPSSVVQLNRDCEIPSEFLPINSMTYKRASDREIVSDHNIQSMASTSTHRRYWRNGKE